MSPFTSRLIAKVSSLGHYGDFAKEHVGQPQPVDQPPTHLKETRRAFSRRNSLQYLSRLRISPQSDYCPSPQITIWDPSALVCTA